MDNRDEKRLRDELADLCEAIAATRDCLGDAGTAHDCAVAIRMGLTKEMAISRLREEKSV